MNTDMYNIYLGEYIASQNPKKYFTKSNQAYCRIVKNCYARFILFIYVTFFL